MVSTAEAIDTPNLHGPVAKFRNDKGIVLQKEKYLKVVLVSLGLVASLTPFDYGRCSQGRGYQQLVNKASITGTAVPIAC